MACVRKVAHVHASQSTARRTILEALVNRFGARNA